MGCRVWGGAPAMRGTRVAGTESDKAVAAYHSALPNSRLGHRRCVLLRSSRAAIGHAYTSPVVDALSTPAPPQFGGADSLSYPAKLSPRLSQSSPSNWQRQRRNGHHRNNRSYRHRRKLSVMYRRNGPCRNGQSCGRIDNEIAVTVIGNAFVAAGGAMVITATAIDATSKS